MNDLRHFRSLARNWEVFGQSDPMFGVLSDPKKFGGKWRPEEFFETGHSHIRHLLGLLGDRDVSFIHGACLDFGCGVGRLTIPLSERFERTVGVDVARSMIDPARRYVRPGDRCEFVLNRYPDLRQFHDETFDFVHTCLVLQHIPPAVSLRYIAEFFRVTRPGGLVVFQVPAIKVPASELSDEALAAKHGLPDAAYRAGIEIENLPQSLETSTRATPRIVLTNRSPVGWRRDIPAGRHICIANHWLHDDNSVAVPDDGRAYLPRTMEPGDRVEIPLVVQAPATPGRYLLEVDLVQERICWFAQKGSPTARVAVDVTASTTTPVSEPVALEPARPSVFERLHRRLRRGAPTFEMHVIPREEVERTVRAHGGEMLHAIDDNAAGERWISYTYVCRRP